MTTSDYSDLEDDGVLDPADSLESDDMLGDTLDTGVDAGEGYRGANRFGTTGEEERQGEGLDRRLGEEEPEPGPDEPWTDENLPSDDGRPQERRAGRLVAPDEGTHQDAEPDAVANEVGIDGGGASAEEAAMHLTDDPPYHG